MDLVPYKIQSPKFTVLVKVLVLIFVKGYILCDVYVQTFANFTNKWAIN